MKTSAESIHNPTKLKTITSIMKKIPRSFALLAGLAASVFLATSSLNATVLIDEDFSGPSLPFGWVVTATAGASYKYSLGASGLVFSDSNPVPSYSTAIVNPGQANGQRSSVNFRYNFVEPVTGDFAASISFTWNNSVGSGNNNSATPTLYFLMQSGDASTVGRAGVYDNWTSGLGSTYATIGANSTAVSSGTLPAISLGTNTININRVDDLVSISWLNGNDIEIFSFSGTNTNAVSNLYLQFGMLKTEAAHKLGELAVNHVYFDAIPEPATTSLIILGVFGIALLNFRRARARSRRC